MAVKTLSTIHEAPAWFRWRGITQKGRLSHLSHGKDSSAVQDSQYLPAGSDVSYLAESLLTESRRSTGWEVVPDM